MALGSNFVFKIATKPLQTEILLLLTACRNSSSPCQMVPFPTSYDVAIPFSHNTCYTDRQTDDRETDDTSYPRVDLTVGQKG